MITWQEIETKAQTIITLASDKSITVATAESCTGGLIAGALTAISGSSAVVDRGFITYSNQAKNEMLSVPETLLREHGAVSKEVACAMSEGAQEKAKTSLAVAVTGIAGPKSDDTLKPVGLVYLALKVDGAQTKCIKMNYKDTTRTGVRHATVMTALEMIETAII